MIIPETLRFDFVMFEEEHKSSYKYFGPGSVMAFLEDSAQIIHETARSLITRSLKLEDRSTLATIDDLSLYEVRRIQYSLDIPYERLVGEG
jgi:hypothetical protein